MEPEATHSWRRAEGPLRDKIQEYERWVRTLDYQVRMLEQERQKLSAIVNHTDAGFFAIDRSLNVVWANQNFIERYGTTSQQTPPTGMPCNQVLCGQESFCAQCPAIKPFKSGITAREFLFRPSQSVSHQELHLQVAGQTRQVYATAMPIRSLDGTVEQVIVMLQDITDLEVLRRSQEALQRSESQLRAVLDTVGEGIITIDSAGAIIMVNQEVQNIWGYRPEELVGHNLQLLMPEHYRKPHAAGLKRYLETGVAHVLGKRLVLEGLRKNGSVFPLEVYINETPVGDRLLFTAAVQDITERKRAEEALRESEERFRQIAENITEVFWLTDPQRTEVIYVSPAYEEIWGRSRQSLCQSPASWGKTIHSEDRQRVLEAVTAKQVKGEFDMEYRIVRPDGSIRWIRDRAYPILNEKGEVHRIAGIAEDITQEKQLAEQFRQSQKMDAIGQLAGGIAHDFNNLLTAIDGYSGFVLEQVASDNPLRKDVEEIKKATERAAALTHQLLAFSRRQVMQPARLNLNELVAGMEGMLRRLIGENIELVTVCAPDLAPVRADPHQFEQVIMNLTVNARDAMLEGGRLTIETANVGLDEPFIQQHVGAQLGAYAMLSVSDTGCGMDAGVQKHLFEPFFTTKEKGKGTGLGLSTVYGIVKQSGGYISVYSEPGRGSCFKIYLPQVVEPAAEKPVQAAPANAAGGTETILLVEDEEAVRALAAKVLRAKGYTVLEAGDGKEAQTVLKEHTGSLHLLVTDVVMPKMGGPELAKWLRRVRRGLKVLFMTGYTDHSAFREGMLPPGTALLSKPFSPQGLAQKVREVLDGTRSCVLPSDKERN